MDSAHLTGVRIRARVRARLNVRLGGAGSDHLTGALMSGDEPAGRDHSGGGSSTWLG
jgi:hypothetical protein